jgi:hypothetical protein
MLDPFRSEKFYRTLEESTMLGVIRAVAVLVCLYAMVPPVEGQQRVSPRNSYERILAVVPLIGSGTHDDPIRPMFAPAPNAIDTVGRTGVIAYTYVLSDDGTLALAEFVLRDRRQFQPFLSTASAAGIASTQIFIRSANTRAEIETAFKKYKKDFDSSKFGAWVR